MKRQYAYLAALCACAAVTAIFCAAALAVPGSGNGNSANAPGQQKQEQAAPAPAAAPAPTASPAAPAAQQQSPSTPPGQAKKAAAPAAQQQSQSSPGQAKKAAASGSASSSPSAPARQSSPGQARQAAKASSSSAGVKPASGTTHWTHCTTGTSRAGATCTSSDNGHTVQVKADVSKQYGNGKTAAQIAVSRGGVGVQLTGPGNSQPHKVSACGKPNNRSGGVDVHAVKSYSAAACAPAIAAPQVMQTQKQSSVCGQSTISTTSTEVVGVLHGKSPHLMTNVHSAHFTKHSDQQVTATSTHTQVVPTGESCSSSSAQEQQQTQSSAGVSSSANVAANTASTAAPNTTSNTTSNTAATTSQTSAAAAAAPAAQTAAGGVAGAQKTLAKPTAKPAAKHGVLGTVTRVSGGTLPFTGFPIWLAVLIAAGLILGGLALRRRSHGVRV